MNLFFLLLEEFSCAYCIPKKIKKLPKNLLSQSQQAAGFFANFFASRPAISNYYFGRSKLRGFKPKIVIKIKKLI
jgi:hypothetical protein